MGERAGQGGELGGSRPLILTVNAGSSSIKFAVFDAAPLKRVLGGEVERIGTPGARLIVTGAGSVETETRAVGAATFAGGTENILAYVRERLGMVARIAGIGHRVVNGGVGLLRHQMLTEEVIAELRRMQALDLTHLPREIALIESFRKTFPAIPQVACFDTTFHRDLPRVAQLLAIPRRLSGCGRAAVGISWAIVYAI